MEDMNNSQDKNPFKIGLGLDWYSSRDGSDFSNFSHGVSETDRLKYERIVLNQAIEQVIYGIESYLQTKDLEATQVFSHGLVYMIDIIKKSYPEAAGLLEELHKGVALLGTNREVNLAEIRDKLTKIKSDLNLDREEYFEFAKEKGVGREELLKKSLYRSLQSLLPHNISNKQIVEAIEVWKLSFGTSLEDAVIKTKELLDLLSGDEFWSDVWNNSNELFVLNQIIEDADSSSNIVH